MKVFTPIGFELLGSLLDAPTLSIFLSKFKKDEAMDVHPVCLFICD